MATRKHYHADTPGQHDIWLHDDAGQWLVQERLGGPASNSRFRHFTSQGLAETYARAIMNNSATSEWRELPVTHNSHANRVAR